SQVAVVDDLRSQGSEPEEAVDESVDPGALVGGQTQRATGTSHRRGRLVQDARGPQLMDRPSLLRGGERRPGFCEILAVDLPGHDPSVPLGGALPADLRMTGLFRKSANERGIAWQIG